MVVVRVVVVVVVVGGGCGGGEGSVFAGSPLDPTGIQPLSHLAIHTAGAEPSRGSQCEAGRDSRAEQRDQRRPTAPILQQTACRKRRSRSCEKHTVLGIWHTASSSWALRNPLLPRTRGTQRHRRSQGKGVRMGEHGRGQHISSLTLSQTQKEQRG